MKYMYINKFQYQQISHILISMRLLHVAGNVFLIAIFMEHR